MELKVVRNVKKGPFVEFNVSGTGSHYEHWDDASFFLEDETFGVFADSFDASTPDFNYYGPTRYTQAELDKLREQLIARQAQLRDAVDYDSFIQVVDRSRMGSNFLSELERESYNLRINWGKALESLREVNATLIEIADQCIKEKRVLWVCGI